ncbi:hypothetical protein IPL68_01680 [Candidatus Saccharibacteria bacterium]|nr:MAG: hypothetical protein IPL68_01680 [Candidatus Saccharibacteria bacterium]
MESWTAADGTELFARRNMPSGKNRGGIPVCAPIFGPGETVGLNQHGFARNCTWVVEEQKESQVKLSLDNPSSQVESLPPVYAGCGMELDLELLESGLCETLTIRNIGIEPFAVNPAFHPYFPVLADASAEQAEVTIDGRSYSFTTEGLLATQKIDSVGSTAILKTSQGTWTISGEGLPLFAIWSESPADFLCVEPTESGYLTDNLATQLQPNASMKISIEIAFIKNSA